MSYIDSFAQQSNPVSIFVSNASGSVVAFRNNASGSVFVVTFLQLINRTSNSGDACYIFLLRLNVALHSGNVGAGVNDRFPLVCEYAIGVGDELQVEAVAGHWDATITGHYEAAQLSGPV